MERVDKLENLVNNMMEIGLIIYLTVMKFKKYPNGDVYKGVERK